jgi:hypothetical protein
MRQCLMLELDRVRGTHSCFLNGRALTAISPSRSYYLIPLTEIEDRNVLVLEVETGESSGDSSDRQQDWGQIALVVHSLEHPGGQTGRPLGGLDALT